MARSIRSILILALAFLMIGGAISAQDEDTKTTREALSLVARVNSLENDCEFWLEAKLVGTQAEVNHVQHQLVVQLEQDLEHTRKEVRALAKEMVLVYADPEASPEIDTAAMAQQFDRMVAHLQAKELIYKSFARDNGAGNKYRLLGDYINLLRKELKMPKVTYALNQTEDTRTDQATE